MIAHYAPAGDGSPGVIRIRQLVERNWDVQRFVSTMTMLVAGFSVGSADSRTADSHVAQQNSCAETDAELHPIREVPHWDWSG
jgi:hypothetical protein